MLRYSLLNYCSKHIEILVFQNIAKYYTTWKLLIFVWGCLGSEIVQTIQR